MKWHGLYQSVSHSVTAVVPEYWLPLRPALLHTAVALPLGNSHSSPSCFWVPFAPSPAFISTLQAVPFQSIISSPPTLALWERGKEGSILRGVEFFYHSWHPWRSVTRHFALSFTLFFSSLWALLLKASSFYLPLKSHSSLPSKPASFFSLLFLVFSHVCPYILLSSWVSCWSSWGGRASLRTHESTERIGIKWPKKRKKTKVWEGVREHFPSVHVDACMFKETKDKIGWSHQQVWLGGCNR